MQLARAIRSGTFCASSEPALLATASEIINLTHYQTELHYQWSGIRDRADRAGLSGNKMSIADFIVRCARLRKADTRMKSGNHVLRPLRISANLAMEAKSLVGNGLQLVGLLPGPREPRILGRTKLLVYRR